MTQTVLVQKKDGRRRPHSKEHKAKISASWTPERRAEQSAKMKTTMSGKNNHNYGKAHSKETRVKMSISKTGENHPNFGKTLPEETKARIRVSWTPERRAEQSKAMSGENHPMYGKTASDETRVKMSISKTGENHPNFGKTLPEETKARIRVSWTPEKRAEKSKAMSGESNSSFNNWASREPYCHLWDEPLRERYRNRYGRVCVLSDTLRSVMGSESGLDDFAGHEIFSGRRLSVHHIRGDKMSGCDGTELSLIPLQGKFNTTKFDGLKLEDHPFYITLFLLKDIERKHRRQQ